MTEETKPANPIDNAIAKFTELRLKAVTIVDMLYLDAVLAVLTTVKDEGDAYYKAIEDQRDELLSALEESTDMIIKANKKLIGHANADYRISKNQSLITKAKGATNG